MQQKVIWYEGMALEPQHFQQQTRYFEAILQNKFELLAEYLWGFTELTLDTELLAIGKLGIATARGIFKDGTLFNMPANDKVPVPFTIPEGLTNTILYLALPINYANTADAGEENSKQTFRYQTILRTIRDNIADSYQETDISVGSVNCRFLTEHDDREGYLCLPMLRIKEVRANYQIKFDKAFIPTWLNVQQAEPLVKFLEEVTTLLTQRAEMLANRLSSYQQAALSNIQDLLLLQLSNKYEEIFKSLRRTAFLHPQKLYQTLMEMLAEMATYTQQHRRLAPLGDYEHTNLYETFKPLIQTARKSLSLVLEQHATAITLTNQEFGLWLGTIDDKQLLKTATFILSVYADLPLEILRTSFVAQTKIASVEQIRALVSRSLPGINIQSIPMAPRQIPHYPNVSYFAVSNQGELWEALAVSGQIAVHVSGELPALKMELWAIKV